MSAKSAKLQDKNDKRSSYNLLKWIVALILLAGGAVANYYFATVAWAIRAAGGIVLVVIILGILALTTQGSKVWGFMKGARTELRKVVWPSRQETIQTTLIVVAMVVVTALILWGLDSLFFWAVSWLTGQRG